MNPITVRGSNGDFTEPKDWDETKDGKCSPLPVRRETNDRGRIMHYSNWMPTDEEVETLRAGGVVELLCVGIQPPVAMGVVRRQR